MSSFWHELHYKTSGASTYSEYLEFGWVGSGSAYAIPTPRWYRGGQRVAPTNPNIAYYSLDFVDTTECGDGGVD
jgi:hypothetical protein